ncbi:MAG: FHA domain-containing protein [Bryobacteraceae bacterium]|nr:FHA domain-containing protein [Bryobacteraceae bacterium]
MSRLHEFERRLDETLRSLFRSPASAGEQRAMIEVHRAVLDELAAQVEQMPRGRRVFLHPALTVRIQVPAPERRRAYAAVFQQGDALQRDARARLEDDGAQMPEGFRLRVELAEDLETPFEIVYGEAVEAERKGTAELRVRVVEGAAERAEYEFRKERINIGRLGEVRDGEQRLIRRNDVVFEDSAAAPNSTVSRLHAHLDFDAEAGVYRLYDDRSNYGTSIERGGRLITVPKGSSKGTPVQAGDEILIGRARIRVE